MKVCNRGHSHLRRSSLGIPAESGDKMGLCLGEFHIQRQNHTPNIVKPTRLRSARQEGLVFDRNDELPAA